VDNGSTDSTTSIAKEFGAKILTDYKKTIAGLRNTGAGFATGKILVFIDGDVIITKEWAENILKVISSLEENSRIITGARCGISEKQNWIERRWFLPMMREKSNYMNSGHLIVTKEIFQEIGGFDETLLTGEDWEFCMRAKEKGIEIINNPDLRVIHEGYPKTLRQFICREKWHGIQDVSDMKSFLKSMPALLAVLYWLTGILGIVLSIYHKSVIYFLAAFTANSMICLLAALNKRRQFPLNIFFYFFLYNVYFFARGLSFVEVLKNMKIKNKIIATGKVLLGLKYIISIVLYISGITFLINRIIKKFHGNLSPLTILCYHSVKEQQLSFFERQLNYLIKKFQFIDSIQLLELIANPKNFNNAVRYICLTFDDCYEDNYFVVRKMLLEKKITAIFFAPSQKLGQASDWDDGSHNQRIMSAGQLKELAKSFTIGAHTQNHIRLGEVDPNVAVSEIMGSKDDLSRLLDQKILFFAYPNGSYNNTIVKCVSDCQFEAALTIEQHTNYSYKNRYTLGRYIVRPEELLSFKLKSNGGYDWFYYIQKSLKTILQG